MTDNTSVSELKRLAEELIAARFSAPQVRDYRNAAHKTKFERLELAYRNYSAALTPERVVALCEAADAGENLYIAIGMGWDLDGVIGVLQEKIDALQAAFPQEKPDAG